MRVYTAWYGEAMTTPREAQVSPPVVAPEKMKLRVYKASDAEYDAAMQAAKSEGVPLAEVVRHSLAQYAARVQRKQANRLKREAAALKATKRSKTRKTGAKGTAA